MVQFDNQYRQIKVKIVYYGPALGGKTTCLQHIHRSTDPDRRTKLYSLSTAADRTLFFDLLSLDLGRIRGYRLALQLYTVPGQVQYNATRRAVLSGADGVVFVADSQIEQREANRESLEDLWGNLAANGLDRDTIPLVLQYNKRDLEPLLSIEDMDAHLNQREMPTFPTVAVSGEGVMDGFARAAELTLAAVAEKLGVGSNPQAVERLQTQVSAALEPYMGGEGAATDVEVIRPQVETSADEVLNHEALVGEAVRANVAMTDLAARLDTLQRQVERRAQVMQAIAEFGQSVSEERDTAGVLRQLLKTAAKHLRLQAGAILVVPGSGELREAAVHGLKEDPLLGTTDGAGEPLALTVLNERTARLIVPEVEAEGDDFFQAAVETAGFQSALAVPMVAQERIVGLLTGYTSGGRPILEEDDLQLASVLAATAAMGYANAAAWRRLEDLNRGLEAQVAERTRELRSTLDDVERLNKDLGDKNEQVERAYRDLAELDRIKNELIGRVSEQLKAPMSSLRTAATILGQGAEGLPEKSARFVTIIHGEAEKLSEIVDSVVEASVLGSTQQRPETTMVPAEELFRRAIAPIRDLAQERSVKLQILIPSDLEAVSCDPATMESALRAVIKNAVEFNRRGGEAKVEVRRVLRANEQWLLFKVSDTGIGIPESDLASVFDSFWQGENAVAGTSRGVGLGLTIAKRVVENHGGTITVESTEQQGTRVTVTLPQ